MKQHWGSFLALTTLCLLWLGFGHARALQDGQHHLISRADDQPVKDIGKFVFRGDGRAPRQVRADGGFRPQGMRSRQDWDIVPEPYNMLRHYHGGPGGCNDEKAIRPGGKWRTAYVSLAQHESTSEHYGDENGWMYEIRALNNMIGDNFFDHEILALGGVHWSQITRWRRNTPGAPWEWNPEYDRGLYENENDARNYEPTILASDSGHFEDDGVADLFPSILRDGTPNIEQEIESDSEEGGDSDGPSAAKKPKVPRRRLNAMEVAQRWIRGVESLPRLFGEFPPNWVTPTSGAENFPGPIEQIFDVDELQGKGLEKTGLQALCRSLC